MWTAVSAVQVQTSCLHNKTWILQNPDSLADMPLSRSPPAQQPPQASGNYHTARRKKAEHHPKGQFHRLEPQKFDSDRGSILYGKDSDRHDPNRGHNYKQKFLHSKHGWAGITAILPLSRLINDSCQRTPSLGNLLDRAFEGKLWLSEFKSFYKKTFVS